MRYLLYVRYGLMAIRLISTLLDKKKNADEKKRVIGEALEVAAQSGNKDVVDVVTVIKSEDVASVIDGLGIIINAVGKK